MQYHVCKSGYGRLNISEQWTDGHRHLISTRRLNVCDWTTRLESVQHERVYIRIPDPNRRVTVMSHRHGKAILGVAKYMIIVKQTAPEWKEHNRLGYAFPPMDNNGGEDREVLELQIRGKAVKAFLQGGKFGHTLKIECNDNDIRKVKDLSRQILKQMK